MRGLGRFSLLSGTIVSAAALAQLALPQIIQLPTQDFTWNWGRSNRVEDRQRPDFDLFGTEQAFLCTLTGMFRPGSRMGDFENLRAFEQTLGQTLYFIQESTQALNYYYRSNDLSWATLDCKLPEETPRDQERTQEKLDRALERAQRDQERRRRRSEPDD